MLFKCSKNIFCVCVCVSIMCPNNVHNYLPIYRWGTHTSTAKVIPTITNYIGIIDKQASSKKSVFYVVRIFLLHRQGEIIYPSDTFQWLISNHDNGPGDVCNHVTMERWVTSRSHSWNCEGISNHFLPCL